MSKILNRPMFRGGGKVSSYGKGIANGLTSKPKRGLVDEPGGYAGISMSGLENYNDIFNNTKKKVFQTGADVVQTAKDKASQGVGKTKNFYDKSKKFLKSPKFSEEGIMKGIKKYGPKYASKAGNFVGSVAKRFPALTYATAAEYVTRPQDVDKVIYEQEEYGPIEGRMRQLFDPTYMSKMRKVYDKGYDDKGNLIAGKEEQPPTGIVLPGGGDPNMYAEKVVDGDGVPELSAKEQVAKDKLLFAELLGGDKAKGKDVSDMLLRFAGSGGNTVGEKFQQYLGNEAQAGPSRTEKINQAAASLAINDYIAGKRSKESMEMMIEKTRFGVDYTLDAREAREDISKMSFSDGLDRMVEVMGGKKMRNDPAVIKNVLSIQMPGQQINIKTFANETLSEVASKDADKFEIGLNIVSYKGGKIILERIGKTMTEVPNLSIT